MQKLVVLVITLVVIGFAVISAIDMGEKSPVIVAGDVVLDPSLEAAAENIDTLFFVIYDEDSPMPMPWGAVKEKLSKPAKSGRFFNFFLTKEKVQLMRENIPPPKKMRVKVRLDKDGVAGRDQPGDIVGQVEHIVFGADNVNVKLETKVP